MNKFALAIGAFVASVSIAAAAHAASDNGSAEEATAMLVKAEAHYKAVGKDQALQDFTSQDKGWQDRDLYIFCIDQTGTNRAHGANAKLVGRDIMGLKDADGKLFIAEIVKVGGAGGGWVDYTWVSPNTKKVEPKSSYVKPFDDLICGVGIYK